MNTSALFRLMWRPSRLFSVQGIMIVSLLSFAALLVFESVYGGQRDRAAAIMALLLPAFAGAAVGQAIADLEHCSFSWTLPGLRRELLFWSISAAVMCSLVVVSFHVALGGPRGLAIFGVAALAFCLGLEVATLHATGDWTPYLREILFPMLMAFLFFSNRSGLFERMTALCRMYPAPSLVIGVTGAGFYLSRRFRPSSARARLSAAKDSPSGTFFRRAAPSAGRQWERSYLFGWLNSWIRLRSAGRRWERSYLGDSLASWIRAGEYENFGMTRLGLPGSIAVHTIGPVALFAALFAGFAFARSFSGDRMDAGDMLYAIIFFPPTRPESVPSYLFSALGPQFAFFVAMFAFRSVVICNIEPRKGWLYPLSRNQLSCVVYWGGLLHSTAVLAAGMIAYLLLAVLALQMSGREFHFEYMPSFLLVPALTWVLMPAAQWMAARYLPYWSPEARRLWLSRAPVSVCGPWNLMSFLFGLAAVAGLVLWRRWLPGVSLLQGLALFTLASIASQWLYRRALIAHFTRGDLV